MVRSEQEVLEAQKDIYLELVEGLLRETNRRGNSCRLAPACRRCRGTNGELPLPLW